MDRLIAVALCICFMPRPTFFFKEKKKGNVTEGKREREGGGLNNTCLLGLLNLQLIILNLESH